MSNPVYTMEAANLFCGTVPTDLNPSNHLVLSEVKLPGLEEQYVDHRPGGAPIAIEIDTFIARLESTFTILGWTPQVATLIGSWTPTQNKFFAYGLIRDRMTGEALQAVAEMTGRLGRADPQNFRRGDGMSWQYSIRGVVYYRLTLAGTEIYEWDFFRNIRKIGGVDQNADLNSALNIGRFTPTVQA